MAKKNYVNVNAGSLTLSSNGADKCLLTINGSNSNGTRVHIQIKLEDYQLPHLVREAAAIGRKRVESAQSIHNRIMNSINP